MRASSAYRGPHGLGGWLMIADPIVVETAARAGFDWVGLDLQHGAWDLHSVFEGIQLLDALGVPAMIRIQRQDLNLIPRVLDHGATGVIVAMVESPDVMRAAIAEARYAPEGRRSYGDSRYGLRRQRDPANVPEALAAVFAMIEERSGFERVEEIARVPGVAGLHVGPVDLGLGLGLGMDRAKPAYEEALDRIISAGHAASIPVTLHAVRGSDVAEAADRGFDGSVVSADIYLLREKFAEEVEAARRVDGVRRLAASGSDHVG